METGPAGRASEAKPNSIGQSATIGLALMVRHRWRQTKASFWFAPALIVLGAVGLATTLVSIDAQVKFSWIERWPLLFGAGADGSRGLLTAVASSMITVAGVVFSITIVALSLTSSQYTSRVLRNFMRDRVNQAVLGVFVGIFAYCLVVLRTIRGGDEGAFVPTLAVLGGLLLAFVGIAFLILFIHHIAMAIQASSIIAAVATETVGAIDRLFPRDQSIEVRDRSAREPASVPDAMAWQPIMAVKTGYLETVDTDALKVFARQRGVCLRMERGVGEFIVEGTPLIFVTADLEISNDMASELNAAYLISRQRTIEQDAGFGIRQIVDIALRALSPGINDTTTAVMCIDYLGAIMVRLATRHIPSLEHVENGELLLIARGATFETLLAEALDQIRHCSSGNAAALTRILRSLNTIAGETTDPARREILRRHTGLVVAIANRTLNPYERAAVIGQSNC